MDLAEIRDCMVSVVIPVYNAEKYIAQCVESILRQTVSDIEVICIDDGSKDRSAQICAAIAERDNRVKVISQHNGGSSKARNRGLRESRGEWICFVDADDWIADNMLERLLDGAASSETVDIVICNNTQVYENGKFRVNPSFEENQIWDTNRIDIELRKFLCKGIKEYRPYGLWLGAPWARIYRREMLLENEIFFPENVARTEDGIFNMYAFENSRTMVYVSEPLYFYRVLSNSISHKPYPGIIKNTEADFQEVRKFAEKYKTDDAVFMKGIDARICTWFHKYLDLLYFQPSYLKENGYRNARCEIISLLQQPLYRDAYHRVDLSVLNNEQKIFVQLVKWRWVAVLYLMVWGRRVLKAMRSC